MNPNHFSNSTTKTTSPRKKTKFWPNSRHRHLQSSTIHRHQYSIQHTHPGPRQCLQADPRNRRKEGHAVDRKIGAKFSNARFVKILKISRPDRHFIEGRDDIRALNKTSHPRLSTPGLHLGMRMRQTKFLEGLRIRDLYPLPMDHLDLLAETDVDQEDQAVEVAADQEDSSVLEDQIPMEDFLEVPAVTEESHQIWILTSLTIQTLQPHTSGWLTTMIWAPWQSWTTLTWRQNFLTPALQQIWTSPQI